MKAYSATSQIGITLGTETIESISTALPNGSMLVYAVGASANTEIYPFRLCTVIVYRVDASRVAWLAIEKGTGGFANGDWSNDIGFSGWKPIATATPPQEFDLPLADGYTPQYTHSCIYYKTQETIVGMNVALIGEIPANSDVIIGTLPVGFQPKATCRGVASSHFSPYGVGSVSIDENGNINVRFTVAQVRCNFTICFLAGD